MRKHRQCPHCKSKKGFRIDYTIKGYGHEDRDFEGNVIDAERETVDDTGDAFCLECGKRIDVERLDTEYT